MIKNTEFKGFENKKMFPVTPHMEVVSMLREMRNQKGDDKI